MVTAATRNMSLEQLKACLSTTNLTNKQIKQILASRGVADAELDEMAAKISNTAATNAATGATVGLTGASTSLRVALNGLKTAFLTNPLTAAITIITTLVPMITGLVNVIKDGAREIDELTDKYKQNHEELQKLKGDYDTSNDSSMISRYEKLSKGVNNLGENVALTAEEYSEYQSIVNKIADQIPSLVSGYDLQGNALLNVKGNIEELVKAYEKLIHVENSGILAKSGDIAEDFANMIDKQSGDTNWSDGHGFWSGILYYLDLVGIFGEEYELKDDTVKILEKLLDNDYTDDYDIYRDLRTESTRYAFSREEIRTALKRAGVEDIDAWDINNSEVADKLEEIIKKDPQKIQNIIDNYYAQFDDVIEKYKTIARAKLSEAFDISSAISGLNYGNISENLQKVAYQIVSNLDYKFLYNLLNSGKGLEQWVTEMLDQLNGLSEVNGKKIETGFELQTQFNGGKISYGEYVGNLRDIGKTIDGLDLKNEVKEQLKISLGLDEGGIVDQYDSLLNRLTSKSLGLSKSTAEGFLNNLSAEELAVAIKIIPELDVGTTVDEIQALIDQQFAAVGKTKFNTVMSGIQGLQAGLDQLDKIYADIADGKDFDYSSILNNKEFTDTFGRLGESYNKFMETILTNPQNIAACQTAFNDLAESYIYNSRALTGLTEQQEAAAIAFLKQHGITLRVLNADEKAAIAKEEKRIETELGTNATFESIIAMKDEENQSISTLQALVNLAIAKLEVNANNIDLASDINQIIDMAEKAGATTKYLKNLAKAKALVADAEIGDHLASTYLDSNGNVIIGYENDYQSAKQWAKEKYELAGELIRSEENEKYTLPEYKGGSTYRDYLEKDSGKNVPEKYDWIEVSISRIERAIKRVQTTAESAYKSLKNRLSATDEQIKHTTKEIEIQEKAYKRYIKEADSIKLSDSLKKKVQDGSININEYSDKTKKLIDEYKEWYEKALECSDSIQELDESLSSLYEKKFDNISTDYENQLSKIEHLTKTYENGLSDLEERGYLGGQEYYTALQQAEQQRITLLEKELVDLTTAMETAIAKGEIEEGSESWYAMQESINGVKEEIQASNTALIEYQNSMRDLDWEVFDFMQERISAITNEAEFLIELLDESKLFDDKGSITGDGLATAGLHAVSYNTYMKQADEYAKEILRINKELANDPSNTELIERREELLELQRESILAAESEKDAIMDMVEEGINKQLDSMKELIDAYKESLQSAKDLYEYQKKIKDHTSNISALQKQLAAYENDTSEETRAKIQQIRVDLEKAQEELEETEYDKYISDTEKMLDDFYEDYEDTLNARMDNIDTLISTMIDTINLNALDISSTIRSACADVGYTITNEMKSIWSSPGKVVSEHGNILFNSSSTSNTVDGVISGISNLLSKGSEIANSILNPSTPDNSASNKMEENNPETNTPAKNETTKEEDTTKKITVGGKINAGSATIYANSSGKNGTKQYFAKDPIYIVLDEENGYLKVRHHGSSSGVTGWFKKSDVKAYKTGGLVDYTGIAQLDGTPSKPELVLNSKDTENFIQLKDVLRKMAENNVQLSPSSNYINGFSSVVPHGILDMSSYISKYREPQENSYSVSVGDINTTIEIDHVMDYDDFVSQVKRDPQFERFIGSITLDKLVGGSKLAKYKYWK